MSQTISGTYIGATGTAIKPGGIGLSTGTLEANATLTFMAVVQGGAGYTYTQYGLSGNRFGGAGGIGVNVAVGGLTNLGGRITGGAGGDGLIPSTGSGDGGIGISLQEADRLQNYGMITGGAGGRGGRDFPKYDGAGGIGADLKAGGLVENMGEITGGAGGGSYALHDPKGGAGGTGLYFGGSGTLYTTGGIAGGIGGAGLGTYSGGTGGIGVEMKAGGRLDNNFGSILGGAGGSGSALSDGGNGGAGILLDRGANVVNGVNLRGGNGGNSSDLGGNGGIGLDDEGGGFITSYGHIAGGNGGSSGPIAAGATGGAGIVLGRDGVLENLGWTQGGEGGNDGGRGGAGVIMDGGTSPYNINDALISGGDGVATGDAPPGYGGIGLEVLTRSTLKNFGTITGGTGAVSKVHINVKYGGGVYFVNSGTLVNGGLIETSGNTDAVLFGGAGRSTLLLDPGSTITGLVEAEGSHNLLALYGTPLPQFGLNTTLSGLGTQYVGFETLAADAGSYWTVSGSVQSLVNAGTIAIAAGTSLDVTGAVGAASTGAFLLTGMATLEIAALLGKATQIEFLGSSAGNLLTIDDPGEFGLHVGKPNYVGPLLEDFQSGDSIYLKGVGSGLTPVFNSLTGVLQIKSGSGAMVASLLFQTASLGAGNFQLTSDSSGGSTLTRS